MCRSSPSAPLSCASSPTSRCVRAIGGIVIIATVFTLAAAALMLLVEHKTYQNFGEACWWSVQTVSTVG